MLSVNCQRCGATNIFDETKAIPTYCSFCGGHLPDMTEYVKRCLNYSVDQRYFNMDMQRMEKNIQYVDRDIERIERETRRERVRNVGTGFHSLKWIALIIYIIFLLVLVLKAFK